MAQTKDWYPQEDAKLTLFAENYVTRLDAATAKAHLPADTFKQSRNSVQAYLDTLALLDAADKEATRLRGLLGKQGRTMETDVRAVANQLKNTVGIDPEVLTLLELTAPPTAPLSRVGAQAPVLTLSAELGVVRGRYVKQGHQGIDLYGCRTGEKDFALLGRYGLSRFEDRRPTRVPGQPEQRDYYAVFVDRDQQVGERSATVSVVVGSRPGTEG